MPEDTVGMSVMVVLIVLLLGAGCLVGLLYAVYSLSPEGSWRRRVGRARRQLAYHQSATQQRLAQLKQRWHHSQQRILETALVEYLSATAVEELEREPGIGPKTVSTLRARGMHNLEQVRRQLASLPAELRSRASLVQSAVHRRCQQLHQTWQQQPEVLQKLSPELYQHWVALQQQYQQELNQLQARFHLLAELSRELERFYEQYRPATTLVAWCRRLLSQTSSPLPSQAWTNPLLNVEAEILRHERSAQTSNKPLPSPPNRSTPTANWPAPSSQTYANPETLQITKPASTSARPAPSFPAKANPATSPAVKPTATTAGSVSAVPFNQTPSSPPAPAIDLLDLEICLLYMLARSDGRLAQQERAWIADYCQRHYGGDLKLANRVRCLCAHYEQAIIDTAATLSKLRQCHQEKRWREIWRELVALARLGNNKNERKWQTLKQLAEILALPLLVSTESQTPAPLQCVSPDQRPADNRDAPNLPVSTNSPIGQSASAPAQPQPAPTSATLNPMQARQLLGLLAQNSLTATNIRQKYRELLPLYNPKQEEIKGPEFVALAEQKRRELREAACVLLRQCGVPDPHRYLDEPDSPPPEYSRDNPALDAIFQM